MDKNSSARFKLFVGLILTSVLAACAFLYAITVAQQRAQGNMNGQASQDQSLVAEIRKRIAGQEEKPAGEAFKNIQILKNVPGGRLLTTMERSYALPGS